MSDTLQLKFNLSRLRNTEKWKALEKERSNAMKLADKAKSEMAGLVRATPEYQLLSSCVKGTHRLEIDGPAVATPVAHIQGHDHDGPLWLEGKKQDPNRYALPIDPKTMNTLLNGKLLSDEEKRQLLVERGWIKDQPLTPHSDPDQKNK